MSRHGPHGPPPAPGEWTSFYWGQHYLGSLEAILAAVPLWFFGPSPLILKLVPLGDLSRVPRPSSTPGRRLLPRSSAFWATALVGCSPAFLMIWSMKSRGYMSALLLGTAALLVAARILRSPKNRVHAALGLLLGLGWWGHFLVIVYLVPIAITLLLVDEPQTDPPPPSAGRFVPPRKSPLLDLQSGSSLGISRALGCPADALSQGSAETVLTVGLPILIRSPPELGTPGSLPPLASILLVGIPVLCAGLAGCEPGGLLGERMRSGFGGCCSSSHSPLRSSFLAADSPGSWMSRVICFRSTRSCSSSLPTASLPSADGGDGCFRWSPSCGLATTSSVPPGSRLSNLPKT